MLTIITKTSKVKNEAFAFISWVLGNDELPRSCQVRSGTEVGGGGQGGNVLQAVVQAG